MGTADSREGVRAFMERRDPEWSLSTPLADSWLGPLTGWHFLGGLLGFDLLAALWSRKVLRTQLS